MEIADLEGLFVPGTYYTMVRNNRRLYFRAIEYQKAYKMWNLKVPFGTQGFSSLHDHEAKTIEILTEEEQIKKIDP